MMQIIINNGIGGGTGLPGSGGGTPFSNTYSLDFDGVDDYVGTNSKIIGSDITLSGWVNFNGGSYTGNAPQFPLSITPSNTQVDNETLGRFYKSGRGMEITIQCYDQTGGNYSTYSVRSFDFEGAGWQHVCFTYNVTTKHIYVYLNGVSQTWTNFGGTITTPYLTAVGTRLYESDLTIGRVRPISASGTYLGLVDEVSTYNRILTQEEITSISAAPTDLTDLSPTVWLRMGDNGAYKSPQFLLPNNENKDKVSNYSFEFDGVDDRVQLSSDFVRKGEFTVSFWMKPVSAGSPISEIYPIGTFPGNENYIKLDQISVLWLRLGATTVIFNEAVYGGGANNLVLDTWQNIVFIRDSSNVIRCYRNGADFGYNVAAATNSNTLTLNSFGRIISNSFGFEGGLDEIAFWNSDETANLSTIYNGGEPTTLPSGAVAHYKMGEEANFTSNWLVDNSALTNYSKRSFEFDGIDDYISVTPNPLTDFTVSFWIKPSSGVGASFDGILGQGTTSPQGGILRYVAYDGTGSVGNVLVRLAAWTNVSGSITNGVWTNVVLTYDSVADELKGYNNGSLYTTISNPDFSAQTTNAHSFERIGLRNGLNGTEFNGGIDEVAVWDSALTDISSIYNGGTPTTISGAVAHWRMGEDASFDGTNWTLPNNVGSNNGTSNAMTVDSLVGEAANYSGGGISNAMTIEDRVGNAPNSDNNALSYNMESVDRTTDVPT